MLKSMLACCKLYISESRNILPLKSIEQAAGLYPDAVIVNKFKDEAYNRVGYTLVSSLSAILGLILDLELLIISASIRWLSLRLIRPQASRRWRQRPLAKACKEPSTTFITHTYRVPIYFPHLKYKRIRSEEDSNSDRKIPGVPTFVYGAAHEQGRTLASIRRELGYFKPNSPGYQWASGLFLDPSRLKPDNGPSNVNPARGLVVIGATPWVDNYNAPVRSTDITVVRRIARRVSGRGGGFESVQAMALAHGEDCIEVACNLLAPDRVGADRVQLEIERLAAEEGLVVGQGYFTDFSQDRIIESYLRKLINY